MDGENRKQSKTDGKASNDWGEAFKTLYSPSISDSDGGSETKLEEIERSSSKISDSSDNVSSSSSNSSSADFFQVNPKELPKSRVSIDIPKPNEVTKQLYESGKTDVSIEGWHGLEESTRDSHESIFSDVTHESFQPHILPTQYPPVQMMERPGSFDPHKIPAFNRQSTSNWSTESHESLFSISIGNLSFSRDALRMSADVYRTGELPKTGEFFKSREIPLSRELHRTGESHNCREFKFHNMNKTGSITIKETLPAAEGVEPNEKTDASKNISEYMKPGVKAVIDKPSSDVPEACVNTLESSKISNQSSAYPIKKKRACPVCHFLYCCCCKWPSCCCKWSSCSFTWFCCCCSRSCCHLKCPTWSTCCVCPSCPSCTCSSLCCSCGCACCYCWRPRPHCDNCESFYMGATVEPSKNVTGPICSTDAPLCLASSQVKTVA